jgi:hypothetical protein
MNPGGRTIEVPEIDHLPGHAAEVRGYAISNARRTVLLDGSTHPQRYGPGEWGVRLGSRYCPDNATPHPTAWDGQHGGTFMSVEDARELVEHLQRCIRWAEAQQLLTDAPQAQPICV